MIYLQLILYPESRLFRNHKPKRNTTNVIPLDDGPSLFFAQRVDGNVNECNSGTQTIQVAWNGGVTPYLSDDNESDLFQYYVGYSDSSGVQYPMYLFR